MKDKINILEPNQVSQELSYEHWLEANKKKNWLIRTYFFEASLLGLALPGPEAIFIFVQFSSTDDDELVFVTLDLQMDLKLRR